MQSVILGSAGAQLRQSPRPTPILGEAGKPSRERTELLVNIDPGNVRHPLNAPAWLAFRYGRCDPLQINDGLHLMHFVN